MGGEWLRRAHRNAWQGGARGRGDADRWLRQV